MDLLSDRQKLVASNIANIDTPGYKSKDIDFQSEFASMTQGQAPDVIDTPGLVTKNDGNNVSLDRETRLLAENSMRFTMAENLLRSQVLLVREAIQGGLRLVSLFGALSVSASGMAAQRTRAELLTENLANSETTRTADGGPYRRQDVVFEAQPQTSPFSSVFQDELGEGIGRRSRVGYRAGHAAPDKRYIPGHPDADSKGYVSFPHINPAEDMVDLLSSTRGYEANVAAMGAVKNMISSSIDLLRT